MYLSFRHLLCQIFHDMMERNQVRRPSEPNRILETVSKQCLPPTSPPLSFLFSLLSSPPLSYHFVLSLFPFSLLLLPFPSSSPFILSPLLSSPLLSSPLLPSLPPSLPPLQAQNHPTVHEQIQACIPILEDFILQILQRLRETIQDVPYGIRWLCKAIRALVQEKFPDVTTERMNSLIGGFFLLRYVNPIIVSPHGKIYVHWVTSTSRPV